MDADRTSLDDIGIRSPFFGVCFEKARESKTEGLVRLKNKELTNLKGP